MARYIHTFNILGPSNGVQRSKQGPRVSKDITTLQQDENSFDSEDLSYVGSERADDEQSSEMSSEEDGSNQDEMFVNEEELRALAQSATINPARYFFRVDGDMDMTKQRDESKYSKKITIQSRIYPNTIQRKTNHIQTHGQRSETSSHWKSTRKST